MCGYENIWYILMCAVGSNSIWGGKRNKHCDAAICAACMNKVLRVKYWEGPPSPPPPPPPPPVPTPMVSHDSQVP